MMERRDDSKRGAAARPKERKREPWHHFFFPGPAGVPTLLSLCEGASAMSTTAAVAAFLSMTATTLDVKDGLRGPRRDLRAVTDVSSSRGEWPRRKQREGEKAGGEWESVGKGRRK